jgi:allantoate deiminase
MGAVIFARLTSLAALGDKEGALTRLYLSPAHRKAADLVMREAGMTARESMRSATSLAATIPTGRTPRISLGSPYW